jgi:hypothetical protein
METHASKVRNVARPQATHATHALSMRFIDNAERIGALLNFAPCTLARDADFRRLVAASLARENEHILSMLAS